MRTLLLASAALLIAGCSTDPMNQPAMLRASMTGIQEVPGPGDSDGNGTAEIRVVPSTGQVCWNLYARSIDPATAAHIHRGSEGVAGPVVLMLSPPDASGHSQGCATVDVALAREIATQGYLFYANVHSAAFPNGAIRGQLRGGPASRETPRPAM